MPTTYKEAFEKGAEHAVVVIKKHVAQWIESKRSEATELLERKLLSDLEEYLCLKKELENVD